MSRQHTIQIRLTPDELESLRLMAETEGRPLSWVVRDRLFGRAAQVERAGTKSVRPKPDDDMAGLKSELALMQKRHGANHPEVFRIKQRIKQLNE